MLLRHGSHTQRVAQVKEIHSFNGLDLGQRRAPATLGERQSIAQKGVRAIDARNSQLENDSNAAKTSVRDPGLSTDEREHPFV